MNLSGISARKDATPVKMESTRSVLNESHHVSQSKPRLGIKQALTKDKITSGIKSRDTQNLLANLQKINKELKSMNEFKQTLPQPDPSTILPTQPSNPQPSSHRETSAAQDQNPDPSPDQNPISSTKKIPQGGNLSTSRTANFAEMSYHNSNY